ncbi:MAG: hypothetical protein KAH44_29620 [Oricola sp.]|nr:hypothetical protein [Oricola sp.]
MTRRRGFLPSFDWEREEARSGEDAPTITPAQCRMARAGIVMSVRDLARLADVSGLAVTRFENGNTDCPETIVRRFRRILESRGARFVSGPKGEGVKIEARDRANG